jgi:hypothetical protein
MKTHDQSPSSNHPLIQPGARGILPKPNARGQSTGNVLSKKGEIRFPPNLRVVGTWGSDALAHLKYIRRSGTKRYDTEFSSNSQPARKFLVHPVARPQSMS